jgi:oligopeptide transport system substrate-binding protein
VAVRHPASAATTLAAGLLAAAVVLTGCAPAGGDGGQVIVASGSEPVNPLIPVNTVEPGGARVVDNIFAGLVTYTADGGAVNDVAESIEASDDRKVFTVTVRSSQSFTNGDDVDAKAFVNAWDWAADSANEALDQSYFSDIVGYLPDDPATPEVERSSLIEEGGLVIVDSRTFEIHLTSALADYPQRLGHRAYFPLPQSFFDDPEAFGRHPIGNGPYMLDGADAWQHGERIDLAVNPEYEGPRVPMNDGVSLRFYADPETAYVDVLAGYLDVLDTIPSTATTTFRDELGPRSLDQAGSTLWSITIPTRLPRLSGPEGELRRAALSMAIDREAIIAQLFPGLRIPARDFASPVIEGYDENLPGAENLAFDDETAKEKWLEADALVVWGDQSLQIGYTADSDDQAWVAAVASSISRVLGIDAVGVAFPTEAELDAAIADRSIAAAFRTVQTAPYPSALAYLSPRYLTKGATNTGVYSNRLVDLQLKAANTARTTADIAIAVRKAQRILLTDLPAIPLWYSTVQVGTGPAVSDVGVDWTGLPQYYLITRKR